MADRPVIMQASHIQRAMNDARFYTLLPEFLPLKRKIEALHVDLSTGCSPCKKRRVADTVNSDFVSIMNSLSPDGFARLKKYVGAERLLVRALDRTRNKIVMKEV
jgi:hypothetical protein